MGAGVKVLCVGGPLDGQRKEVRDRRSVIAGSTIAEPGAMPVEFRYDIERIMADTEWFFVAHPRGTKSKTTIRRLLDGYGTKPL